MTALHDGPGPSPRGDTAAARPQPGAATWVPVCAVERLLPGRGVAALFGRIQVAVFRTASGELFALGNVDPFSGAAVLSRGIVGDRGGVPVVASPVFKQAFGLRDGRCLDDDAVAVPTYPVRVRDGKVQVGLP